MRKLIGTLLIFGLISCGVRKPKMESINNDSLTNEQVNSILAEYKIYYEKPIIIDSSNQIMIPISTEQNGKKKYRKDINYSTSFPKYWNVLFYNRKTGETRLLTEDKIRISKIHVFQDDNYRKDNKTIKNKIIYQIVASDFNNDGDLDSFDPEYLFSSEIDGTDLKRISPLNEELQYFEVIPKSNQILISTLRDINQDSIFNRQDQSIWYKAELINQNWKTNEILDSVGRKEIENLFFEQWIKKK